ncbi:MAG: autotransporter-associated beta strand repeat-containing protein [Kiritimatiellae bacterium]|nr:autotransporter-associated beta strand repeat-containing protein [Kiritimatiellia bacterium]
MNKNTITAALSVTLCALVHSASAATVTLAPPAGTTTNVLQVFSGDTALVVAGPGTVSLSAANSHTGGTTLSGGTLALSGDVPASGRSQIGTGALTITGGTLRGSGTVARGIAATAATTLAGDPALALAGNNDFQAGAAFAEGTVEISGGETAFGGRIDLGNQAGETATLRVSGGTVTSAGNLQRGYVANANSTLIMTGGTFDVGGKNSVVGFNGGPVVATTDISGGASLRNLGNFYIHSNGGSSSVNEVIVHDGGTFGFVSFYDSASATTTLLVDGGTLANDTTGASSSRTSSNANGWIRNNITSLKAGSGGMTFKTDNGADAGLAQIRMPIFAETAGEGDTANGVTFENGNWGYYVAGNAYEGPTVIKNGAALFLYSSGTIPSGSAVTVASGGELCVCGDANRPKTVSSLVLQDGAILGFGSNLNALTVSESATLPSFAKIALYNSANPTTGKNNTAGTYAVLKVPSAYADALRSVRWSCATAASGKSYTFSVATSGDTATLSMTIADDASGAISGSSTLAANYSVDSDIVVNNSGTLVAQGNIVGSSTGGSITINNGGTLDASGGYIRPVSSDGNSFHLYLNNGGSLVVDRIEGSSNSTLANQANATPMFHFNGGTIFPSFAKMPNDGNRFLLNYQAALLGEYGVVIDMTRLQRPEGYTRWVRSSVQGNVNHDPSCADSDGGITVKGIKGDRSLVLFGSRFAGSTMDGGIHVEDGATIALHRSAGTGIAIEVAPGGWLRPYNGTTTMNIGDLALGAGGAVEPVRLDIANTANSIPGAVISDSISVLSPVAVSLATDNQADPAVEAGVYTALVYSASTTLDTSLFSSADPAYTLTATEESISDGDYEGQKALVVTFAKNDLRLENGAMQTLSSGATYGDIYIGDFNVAANPSLIVSGGTISADGTLHLAYQPADGASSADKHVVSYVQNGGEVSVGELKSMYRGGDSQKGRVSAEITLNGGSLAVVGDAQLGCNQTRQGYTTTITVNAGASMTVGGDLTLTYYNGASMAPQGIVNINGGSLTVAGDIDLSRCTNNVGASYVQDGGVFLRGGVLSAANIVQTVDYTPVQRLVFDGGTYAPSANAAGRTLSGLTTAHVSTNGAVISTANLPAGETYEIAQALLADPALDGATDGGLVKKGAGTLALSGANTYTGRTVVEAGTLAVANAAALTGDLTVANGALLDASGLDLALEDVAASGVVAADSLSVSDAFELVGDGTILSVDGNLVLVNRMAIDFSALDEVPSGFVPVAAVGGTITVPELVRARGAGDNTRCDVKVEDGILYAKPTTAAFMMIVR